MQFAYSALTDVGCVRTNNEDMVSVDEARGLAILADGMGGYNAGEVASAIAVQRINTDLGGWLGRPEAESADDETILRRMEDYVERANRSIFELAHTRSDCAGMGTTVVLAVVRAQRLLIGHIGDSRAYRWRKGQLSQLTHDHSLLQELLDAKMITAEQAALSGYRNLVTRALGVDDAVQLETAAHDLQGGDVILLCSDGLSEMVSAADIAAVLQQPAPAAERAQELIDLAKAAGGRDNVSVILIEANGSQEKPGLLGRLRRK